MLNNMHNEHERDTLARESEVAFILAPHFSIISRVIPNGILKFLHIALSC